MGLPNASISTLPHEQRMVRIPAPSGRRQLIPALSEAALPRRQKKRLFKSSTFTRASPRSPASAIQSARRQLLLRRLPSYGGRQQPVESARRRLRAICRDRCRCRSKSRDRSPPNCSSERPSALGATTVRIGRTAAYERRCSHLQSDDAGARRVGGSRTLCLRARNTVGRSAAH
jgi:hypothetical protein